MTREPGGDRAIRPRRGTLVAGLVLVVAVLAPASGWDGRTALALMVLVPLLGAVLAGLSSPRGAWMGGLILALGATLARPTAAGFPWTDGLLLAGLVFSAQVAASWADAHAPRPEATATAPAGRWARIIVDGSGPADGTGRAVRVPAPPRRDPDRRRLSRRAEPRNPVLLHSGR